MNVIMKGYHDGPTQILLQEDIASLFGATK
jgi:hypothetical protein